MSDATDQNSQAVPSAPPPPSTLSPEEASKLIRFALSELDAENGHHDFEHLCRHLTRRKIAPNIIPATGPVSGGGDQGADFETYKVSTVSSGYASPFFSQAVQEKWLFACSLEKNYKKKVKSDLAAAKKFVEKVDQVTFFHHLPVKTADRNKLKKEAIEQFGIGLEIVDGPAIAEMLADPESLWIAERYLSIPSELLLQRAESSPEWFEAILRRTYSANSLSSANFFELKEAVRFATWEPERHSDLAKLLKDIEIFKQHPFSGIQRKVIYETFVASLRGLQTTVGLENDLRQYFDSIESLTDPAELEDGAVLVGYALGAKARTVLDVPRPELSDWHGRLVKRIDNLTNENPSVGRKCSLLFVQGYLAFNRFLTTEHKEPNSAVGEFLRGGREAVGIWLRLTKMAGQAPMFPVERLSRLLNSLRAELDEIEGIDELIRQADALSARRSGKQKIAEHQIARAESYIQAERFLRALDELHAAHKSSFLGGTPLNAVSVCLQLSRVYSHMKLLFAAKYYGLAAAYAALNLPDDDLRKLAYAGISEAAEADYASGGSLLYFLSAQLFGMVSAEYSMLGSEERKQKEWARIDFYALLLARGAGLLFEKLQKTIVEQVLPSIGLAGMYQEARADLDEFFSAIPDSAALASKAASNGVAPPFSDVGGRRRATWRQLMTNWHLEWETTHDTERQAEALASYLQIILADLATTELSIIPGDVAITVSTHKKPLEIRAISNNKLVERSVLLPVQTDESRDALPSAAEVVALVLLRTISALPNDEFKQRCETRFAAGLRDRLSVYRSPESLFEEFYSREAYAQLYNVGRASPVSMPTHVLQTWKGLSGPQGTHPKYDKEESLKLVRNRYKNVMPMISQTLKTLVADSGFQGTVRSLRQQNWKDWHILIAIEGIKFNYLLNRDQALKELFENGESKALMKIRSQPEDERSPRVPAAVFGEEDMKRSLSLTQMSTLKGYGLDVPQETPNVDGVDKLLGRFNYWDDDVPHADPFSPLAKSVSAMADFGPPQPSA